MNGKVTVCGKVVRLGDPVFVKRGDGSQVVKRDCIFGDSSCCVRLVWEGDVDKLVLSNCYRLVNVCVRQWQGNPYVSLSGDATVSAIYEIEDVDEDLISANQLKEVSSEVLAVHSVVIYIACCMW